MATKTVGLESNGLELWHTIFITSDKVEGYSTECQWEGWVARLPYSEVSDPNEQWEWNPNAPIEARLAAKQTWLDGPLYGGIVPPIK